VNKCPTDSHGSKSNTNIQKCEFHENITKSSFGRGQHFRSSHGDCYVGSDSHIIMIGWNNFSFDPFRTSTLSTAFKNLEIEDNACREMYIIFTIKTCTNSISTHSNPLLYSCLQLLIDKQLSIPQNRKINYKT